MFRPLEVFPKTSCIYECDWTIEKDSDATYDTDPWNPDTDGDGYWDGWIGVYDVGYSDNVILYEEHLHDGNGIEGDEIVNEQTGVHHVSEVSSAVGADIDDDDIEEHSNVHIGERQWGTDPTEIRESPELAFDVEVDYADGFPEASLNTESWESGIENNWALYGISVDLKRDDTDIDGRLGSIEARRNANDLNPDLWMFVTTEPLSGFERGVPDKINNAWGFNFEATSDDYSRRFWDAQLLFPENTLLVFERKITPRSESLVDTGEVVQSPYATKQGVIAGQIGMHEIAHSFGVGEADDTNGRLPFSEVYSGDANDETWEFVEIRGDEVRTWSIMRRGWSGESLIYENDSGYYVFSIEELLTIEKIG